MDRGTRGWIRSAPARAGWLALAIVLIGCGDRLVPGESGLPSYMIGGWKVVSEERVDRTWFQYALRGVCSNAGADAAGAAGIAVSRSPHTVVVEDQIRCGPLAHGQSGATLDTITVRHDRSQPFDPKAITGVVLVWGPETLDRETRITRTRFAYEYYAYLINGTDVEQDVVATVESRSPDTAITDDTVVGRVPAQVRIATTDRFTFQHERAQPYDPSALEWRLRFGAIRTDADVDGDGDVDADDEAAVRACLGRDPRRKCQCAAADLDGDGDVDASDVETTVAQRGRTGLPVTPPDTTPPVVVVSAPTPGSDPGPSPIPVAGTVSETPFIVFVNGIVATVGTGDPLPWSAQAPLGAGGSLLVVKAIDQACNGATTRIPLAAGEDRIAPQVTLVAPARVNAGGVLRVAVDAQDDVAVVAVELFVDGTSAGVRSAAPFTYDVVAPAAPGTTIALRAVARDAAGNTGEASGSVDVVDAEAADAPPVVSALRLPPQAARGATFLASAEASDDRGVAEVRFSVAGGGEVRDATPPYTATLLVPADAPVGSQLRVDVVASDGAGQTATRSGELAVVAASDTSAPTVSLEAPDTAPVGSEVTLDADAVDDVGVAVVRFFADGVQVAETTAPPFSARVPLPAGRAPGSIVIWTATADDFAGNQSESDPTVTRIVAPGAGFAIGEVYDDTTSRPLADATVRVVEAGGAALPVALETKTDAHGAWRFPLSEGRALLHVEREGYTTAIREAVVPATGVVTPLDVRLTPRVAPTPLARNEGGALVAGDGSARLEVPIGALAADGGVGLTPIGVQSLPLPLPVGWTPLAAFDVEAAGGFAAPVSLALLGEALRRAPVAVRFDPVARAWRRIGIDASDPAVSRIALPGPDVVALARADAGPAGPPTPEPGDLLVAGPAAALPEAATLDLLPSPHIVFAAPDARADVVARLVATAPLPSGTPIEVRFREAYDQRDGSRIVPATSAQDFLLYAEPEGPTARFVATPLPGLDAVTLDEGAIDLTAGARASGEPALIGPDGGAAATPDGVRLEVAPGALSESTPIGVTRLDATTAALPSDARFTALGGFDLDLGGGSLASAAVVRLPLSENPAAEEQILLVREISVLGRSELELAGVATPSGDGVFVGAGGGGLPLPGVRAGGRYWLVRLAGPAGFVTGEVTRGGVPADDALVRVDTLPFVSRTRTGAPGYAVAAALGVARAFAQDLTNGDTAEGNPSLSVAGAIFPLPLELAPSSLFVESVQPADGVADVGLRDAVTVRFSAPIDPATLSADSFALLRGTAAVPVARAPALDRRAVVVRPVEPLAGGSVYRIEVGAGVRDVFGRSLQAPFASDFTTVAATPPAAPAAGRITLSIPSDGVSELVGAAGAVAGGTLVVADNVTRGVTTSVLARADGSFFGRVAADPEDTVRILLVSAGGLTTELRIPFSDQAGGFVLGPAGGAAFSPAGVVLSALPRVLLAPGTVRITDRALSDLEAPEPAGVRITTGITLDFSPELLNGATALTVSENGGRFEERSAHATPLRVDATAVAPGTTGLASRFTFVARARDAEGRERTVAIETEGRTTACSTPREVVDRSAAPVVALTAPSCLGPDELFTLRADAVQPRFDLSAPFPDGGAASASWLVLRARPLAGAVRWQVEERLAVIPGDDGQRLTTTAAAPLGLRAPGGYWLAALEGDIAWVEGNADGAVVIAAEGSSLVAAPAAVGGAYLLPVPAGRAVNLLRLDAVTGAELSRLAVAPLGAGETRRVARLGDAGLPPLTVEARLGPGGVVHGRAPVAFAFSEPVDPGSVTPASVAIRDASGRSVAVERALVGDGARVELRPLRPWRFGATYTWRVTTDLAGRDGARPAQDETGGFVAFEPSLLARVPGVDVRDAAVAAPFAWVVDADTLRPFGLADPGNPAEGRRLLLGSGADRVASALDAGTPVLLTSIGTPGDYGAIQRIQLEDPLRPLLAGVRRLTTPAGAASLPGVDPRPGVPGPLAIVAGAGVVSTQGIGLQRVTLDGGLGPAPPDLPIQQPPGGATFAGVAAAEGALVAVGDTGLSLYDPATLAPLASASVTGAARDVAMARVGERVLALVAAGLPGGVQIFAVETGSEEAPAPAVVPVARILPGCAVTRVAPDGPFGRGWFACSNGRIGFVDLAGADGLDPIDVDRDGADDRLAGLVDLALAPAAPLGLDLDEGRALGLVSAGAGGLAVAALGPAEAVVTDLRRDVLPGDRDDEEAILGSGRSFHGDRALLAQIDARVPPGSAELRAEIDGDAPFAFAEGGRTRVLVPGRNLLTLVPGATGEDTTAWRLRILAGADELAAVAGTFAPVPVDDLVLVAAADLEITSPGATPIAVSGRGADERLYNLAPLARFEFDDPAFGVVDADGNFQPVGGGESEIAIEVAGQRLSAAVSSTLPPAVGGLAVDPAELRLAAGRGPATLEVTGFLTDGASRPVGAADGLVFTSSAPGVASVDAAGRVVPLAPGRAEITARLGEEDALAVVDVHAFVPPDVTGLRLALERTQVYTDVASLGAEAVIEGTGTLEGLAVEFAVEGLAADESPRIGNAFEDGAATAAFGGLASVGTGRVTARVVDPGDGEIYTAAAAFQVAARNGDDEPNDAVETAVLLEPGATASGAVGGDDAVDVFRIERPLPGTWSFDLSGAGAGASIRDATGAALGTLVGDGASTALALPASATPLIVRVTSAGPAVEYALAARLAPALPSITAIEPPEAPPGATVRIRGSGFGARASDHVVSFGGLNVEASSVAPDAVEVTVPAYARNAAVSVWVASRESNALPFATGLSGHWFEDVVEPDPRTIEYVTDPLSGQQIMAERIEVAFRPEILRPQVEALAATLGAEITGVWPPHNSYQLRFPGLDVPALRSRLTTIEALPEVRFARVLYELLENSFPIAGRDDFPDRTIPTSPRRRSHARLAGAYAQIRAPEAWQAIADSGFFEKPGDFHPVRVAVVDTGPAVPTPIATPQVQDAIQVQDFKVYPGLVTPPTFDHGWHVSALIGARNVDDPLRRMTGLLGGLLPAGVAPFYRIDLYDATEPDGSGNPKPRSIDFTEARYALKGCSGLAPECSTTLPMEIVNFSFGTLVADADIGGQSSFYKTLIKQDRPDALFVFAAGNDNRPARRHVPSSLAADPDVGNRVLNVAAVGTGYRLDADDGRADVRASFSNYGRTLDVAAPGEAVLSINTAGTDDPDGCKPAGLGRTNSFDFFCGTSAAAPLVAGVAAMAKALDPTLTAADLKTLIVDSATPLRAVPRARSWGDWSTPRRLDALRAVQLALERRGRAPGGGVATTDRVTPFNPGRRRYLFVPDRPEDRLVRMTLGASFDATLAEADQLTAAPEALDGEGCRGPYAAQASLSGDKVYLACRDSNQVLVWSANENRGAAFGGANRVVSPAIALTRGGAAYALPNFSSIQMGLSADGQILAVPLAGRRIAFIDTRSDRIAEVRRFASTVNVGEVRAVAFDSRDTLLAVTSEAPQPGRPARGQLVRRPRHATQPRWSIDTSRGLTVRRLYESGSADLDEPRGLAIDRRDDGDHVYVFYGGSLTDTAATSHRTSTLAPASATAPRIRENVSGRRGPEFSAGGFVSSRVADSVLETATSLASGMAIDSLGRRAFVVFRGTGNLGYLPAGTGPFDSLFAATRILGNFPEPRVEQRTALVTIQVDPSGNASTTEVVATPDFRDGRLYEQTQFPLSLALDPGGELLAAHLTGRPSALRFWSARKIEDAFVAMTEAGDPFGSTTLDTRAVDPWVADFPIPVLAAPSLTFSPTLVIAAPGPGISRGSLGVHVVTRDERIDRIDCAVLNPSTRAVVRTDSGLTLDPSQTRSGVPRRIGGGALGSTTPVCRFPNVPAGRWLLRVHAQTSTGGELVTETPFVQERW